MQGEVHEHSSLLASLLKNGQAVGEISGMIDTQAIKQTAHRKAQKHIYDELRNAKNSEENLI